MIQPCRVRRLDAWPFQPLDCLDYAGSGRASGARCLVSAALPMGLITALGSTREIAVRIAAWLRGCIAVCCPGTLHAYSPSLARMLLALCASNQSLERSSGGRPCTAFCQDDGGNAAHLLLPLTTASLLLVGPTRGYHMRSAASTNNTVGAQRGCVGVFVRAGCPCICCIATHHAAPCSCRGKPDSFTPIDITLHHCPSSAALPVGTPGMGNGGAVDSCRAWFPRSAAAPAAPGGGGPAVALVRDVGRSLLKSIKTSSRVMCSRNEPSGNRVLPTPSNKAALADGPAVTTAAS